jgi:hypothetical protein
MKPIEFRNARLARSASCGARGQMPAADRAATFQ